MSTAVSTARYTVTGMTCEHCARSVTEEIGQLAGVTDVSVELSTGAVQVTSTEPVDNEAVKTAVENAGYQLASG